MRASFVDLDGIQTRYYYEGRGPALLLLHGVGMAADSWMHNMDPLARDFFVCAPDQLGGGFTGCGDYQGGPPQPYLVDHLVRLVDELKIDRFAVAGSSLGALIATLLYFRMPDRVERLIIIGSGSLLGSNLDEMKAGMTRSYQNGRTAFSDPTLESCRARMGNIVYDIETIPDEVILMQLTCYALPWALRSYDHRMQGLMDFDNGRDYLVGPRLEQLRLPVLVIWGRQDPRGNYEHAMEDFKRLPDGRVVTFDRCGHMPHLEQPDEFNRTVRDFLHEA